MRINEKDLSHPFGSDSGETEQKMLLQNVFRANSDTQTQPGGEPQPWNIQEPVTEHWTSPRVEDRF